MVGYGFVPRFLRLFLIWVYSKVSTYIFVGLFLICSRDLGLEKEFGLWRMENEGKRTRNSSFKN